jgi:hypothetical protein
MTRRVHVRARIGLQRLACSSAGLVVVLGLATRAAGQGVPNAKDFKLDFALPNAPAFQLLKPNEELLLRPGTVREMALALSKSFDSTGAFALPREFAVEFSPALLMKGDQLTRKQYEDDAFLYRIRISAATQRSSESTKLSSVALGLRATLRDDGDLRTNPRGRQLDSLLTRVVTGMTRRKQAIQDSLARGGMDIQVAAVVADSLFGDQAQATVEQTINRQIHALEEELWNADRIEVAFAVRGFVSDPVTQRDVRLMSWAGWATAAFGVGRSGQFLIGTRAMASRDDDEFPIEGAVSSRIYFGNNGAKAFIEVGGDIKEGGEARALFNSGGEFRFADGGWVNFSLGMESGREAPEGLIAQFGTNLAIFDLFKR